MVDCLVDHPTNHVTMVEPICCNSGMDVANQPTPGSLFGRGWLRMVYEGFVKFNNAAEKKLISIDNEFILV